MFPGKPYILEANINNIQLKMFYYNQQSQGHICFYELMFYLKDGMSIKYITRIERRGVGNSVGNSELVQGFRGDLILTKVNLDTHSFYFMYIFGVFPSNYQKSAH